MKVHIVVEHYFKPERYFSEIAVVAVFESESDAKDFCANNNGGMGRYTIFHNEVTRNSKADYTHPTVTSEPFSVNMTEQEYEMYKKIIDGENK